MKESPTLQMLESMKRHLCSSRVKVYDPLIADDIVPNQMHVFDRFLDAIDIIVILVGHKEIRERIGRLKDKVILDTRNLCDDPGAYKL